MRSMEPLYRVTSKLTFEEYKKFNNAVIKNNHIMLLLIVALILILLGGILLGNIFLLIFAFIYPFLFVIVKNISVKRTFESNKLTKNMDVTFEFYDDYFVEKHAVGEGKIFYNQLNNIIETKTNFYLMIAKNQGYMISKQDMPEGLEQFILKIKNKDIA